MAWRVVSLLLSRLLVSWKHGLADMEPDSWLRARYLGRSQFSSSSTGESDDERKELWAFVVCFLISPGVKGEAEGNVRCEVISWHCCLCRVYLECSRSGNPGEILMFMISIFRELSCVSKRSVPRASILSTLDPKTSLSQVTIVQSANSSAAAIAASGLAPLEIRGW